MPKGRLYLVLSAVLYGILPCLTSIAYRGGLNGVTLTFLRSVLAIPLLLVIIIADKRALRLPPDRLKSVLLLGFFGGTLPILLLYISYQYIPTGVAAALHFIYPLIVVAAMAVITRSRLPRVTVSAVMLVTAGIFMFADPGAGLNTVGLMLSILSGVFYGFYIIYLARSGLEDMDHVVLTFYVTVIMSIALFIFGIASGKLYFRIAPASWSLSVLISFVVTLGAMPLFQLGVRSCGAAEAGIVSALEPVTTLFLGVIVLGEYISAAEVMGGAMIILGILLIERHKSA